MARARIREAGIALSASYTTDLLGNPVGGARQGFGHAGELAAALEFDLHTLLGLTGTTFHVAAAGNWGRDLSARQIENLFPVSEVFEGQSVRLGQMYVEQDLVDGALNLAIGRLTTGNDFATSTLYGNYVSGAINGNPAGITANVASFATAPIASWGVRTIVAPSKELHLAAGVYNADPKVGDDHRNGVDFALNPRDGVLVIAEAGYRRHQGEDDTGLAGTFTIGGYYHSSEVGSVSDPDDERRGNYGLYVLLDPDDLPRGRAEPSGADPLGGANVRADRAGQYLALLCGRRIRVKGPVPRPGQRYQQSRRVLRQVQR